MMLRDLNEIVIWLDAWSPEKGRASSPYHLNNVVLTVFIERSLCGPMNIRPWNDIDKQLWSMAARYYPLLKFPHKPNKYAVFHIYHPLD